MSHITDKLIINPLVSGEYEIPAIKDVSNLQHIEISGPNAISDSLILSFLQRMNELGVSKNISLNIRTSLLGITDSIGSLFSKFKTLNITIELNDVFDRYETIYKSWDDLIENISLLSLSVQNANSPIILMKVNITCLNALYIDEILRFYYTDLKQLFPYLDTRLEFDYKAFPKFLNIDYVPNTFKAIVIDNLNHYIKSDKESISAEDLKNFEKFNSILLINKFNPEFFILAKQEIEKYLRKAKNKNSFQRYLDFLIEDSNGKEKFEEFIDLIPDDKAFEFFKNKNDLYTLSVKKQENLDLRLKIFDEFLQQGNHKLIEIDLRHMASNQFSKDIYGVCLKKYIDYMKQRNSLEKIIPFLMNDYSLEASEVAAENLLIAYSKTENTKATNYFLNLTLAHNSENKFAQNLKKATMTANSYKEIKINLDQSFEKVINDGDADFLVIKLELEKTNKNQLKEVLLDFLKNYSNESVTEPAKSYAWDCMVSGELQRAEIIFKVLSKIVTDFDVFKTMGDIFAQNNSPHEAIEVYNKALELQPENCYILKQLAWRYYEINKKPHGKKLFQKVNFLDPSDQEAEKEILK